MRPVWSAQLINTKGFAFGGQIQADPASSKPERCRLAVWNTEAWDLPDEADYRQRSRRRLRLRASH